MLYWCYRETDEGTAGLHGIVGECDVSEGGERVCPECGHHVVGVVLDENGYPDVHQLRLTYREPTIEAIREDFEQSLFA